MLIFIDDSGDPGFKLGKGSTNFFVIALLIFDDNLEAEKMAVSIKELRRTLHISDHEEFKFNKSSNRVREAFLRTVSEFSFRVRCLVVDKARIHSPELRSKKESFYAYFIKQVLKYSDQTIVDARIHIDGSGDREFRRQFLTYLRRELNSHERIVMKNCKMVDSKGNVLIQAVDMIAGAIRRGHERQETVFRKYIEKHIEDEWLFS